MTAPRITLLGRPGCHLCDDARQVISRVADDLGVAWEERDITQSEEDQREYWEKIPVTLVDGVQHDFWRVSEDRLRRALRLSPGGRPLGAPNGGWLSGQRVGQTLCICSQTTYGRSVAGLSRVILPNAGRVLAWPATAPNRLPGASHVQCRRAIRPGSRARQ
jgi:glutaredoxin